MTEKHTDHGTQYTTVLLFIKAGRKNIQCRSKSKHKLRHRERMSGLCTLSGEECEPEKFVK